MNCRGSLNPSIGIQMTLLLLQHLMRQPRSESIRDLTVMLNVL
jgi:hypothetical protein